jgi:hypothetical protein
MRNWMSKSWVIHLEEHSKFRPDVVEVLFDLLEVVFTEDKVVLSEQDVALTSEELLTTE